MKLEEHKKQFGNLAQDYTKYRRPYEPALFDLFFSLTGKGKKKILDIGCGTGKSTEALVKENTEVFGCDHDPLMIEEAKAQADLKNLNINYIAADVEKLPYQDEEFDAITVGTAFHWFVNDQAMSEIRRVLKSGGLLFIFWTLTVKDIPEEDSIPGELFRKYNWEKVPSELRDLGYISEFLNNNGFENVVTSRLPSINGYTVEEYAGLMKTASAYGILSEEDKMNFSKELTDILRKKLGNREKFVLEDEIQVCYGFKK